MGIPAHDWSVTEGHIAAMMQASTKPVIKKMKVQSYSLLTKNFNDMYCSALNARKDGITHFCMLHSDIIPESFWLDKMLEIMEKYQADMLSAIVPIKDNSGFTSTALDELPYEGAPDHRVRRLTMKEVYTKFPSTFTHERILLNTGLMLINIQNKIFEQCWFNFYDRIERDEETGEFYPISMPEDWLFSRQARMAGAKLFATREVKLIHRGQQGFSNAFAWGKFDTDGKQ